MKNITLITNLNSMLLRKFLACAVVFCVMMSSAGIVQTNTNTSLVDMAKVSADTILAQFFYISSLPVNIITKLFIETSKTVDPMTPYKKQNNNNNDNKTNSSKASLGYSILPNSGLNVLQTLKTKSFKTVKYLSKVKNFGVINYHKIVTYDLSYLKELAKVNIIMILLLAILLTRRNIGNDNIIINIKNNKIARLA